MTRHNTVNVEPTDNKGHVNVDTSHANIEPSQSKCGDNISGGSKKGDSV
jgi:hypothetical protein